MNTLTQDSGCTEFAADTRQPLGECNIETTYPTLRTRGSKTGVTCATTNLTVTSPDPEPLILVSSPTFGVGYADPVIAYIGNDVGGHAQFEARGFIGSGFQLIVKGEIATVIGCGNGSEATNLMTGTYTIEAV